MKDELMGIFNKYAKNYVVQEVLAQHEYMSSFNKTSLNTVRIMSFLRDDGVHILSAIIRFGKEGSRLDNLCSGGSTIGVNDQGYFSSFGLKFNGSVGKGYLFSNEIFEKNHEIKNKKFPFYDDVVDVVKSIHPYFPHFKLVSWDIAIDKNGTPCLIECNLGFPEFVSHQIFNGPIFGNLTEMVLKEVYIK